MTRIRIHGLLVIGALGFAVLSIAGTALADDSRLSVLLPGNGCVSGYKVVAVAERDATNEAGLYSMYDGAVPDMQKSGVCYAHQRVFRNAAGKSITIDIYTLYTWQHAKADYTTQKNSIKALPGFQIWPIKQEACAAQTGGMTTCYVWSANYMASVSVQGAASSDLSTAKSIASFISNKIQAVCHK